MSKVIQLAEKRRNISKARAPRHMRRLSIECIVFPDMPLREADIGRPVAYRFGKDDDRIGFAYWEGPVRDVKGRARDVKGRLCKEGSDKQAFQMDFGMRYSRNESGSFEVLGVVDRGFAGNDEVVVLPAS